MQHCLHITPANLPLVPGTKTRTHERGVSHRMRTYLSALVLIESVVLYLSFWAGALIRYSGDIATAEHWTGAIGPRAAQFSVIAIVALFSVGLYRARQNAAFRETVARLFAAFALATFAEIVLYYLIPTVLTGRGVQALALVTGFFGLLATRCALHVLSGSEQFKRNVLVCGHGTTAAVLGRSCATLGRRGFRIVGYIGTLGDDINADCHPLLPLSSGLMSLVREQKVDEIVVAVDNRRNAFPLHELLECRLSGVRVSDVLTFTERETGRIDLRSLYPSWFIYSGGFRQGVLQRIFKRQFDIVASSLLLLVAVPLLTLAAAALLIESRGKSTVILKQPRVGQRGKVFHMLKLRSMVAEAESDGRPLWASANDPRVTRVGGLLRRFRIDELPQIINILRGEMSFVGPRPERPEFVDMLSTQIPYYRERHAVKPGLAGWAQLCYPYGASVEDARQKLQYDLFYMKNHHPILDLLILLETLEVVIWGKTHLVPITFDEDIEERRIA
jgi:sugar transferase (PEP-CTERM system associated)